MSALLQTLGLRQLSVFHFNHRPTLDQLICWVRRNAKAVVTSLLDMYFNLYV